MTLRAVARPEDRAENPRPRVLVVGAQGMLGRVVAHVLGDEAGVDVVPSARVAPGPGWVTLDAAAGLRAVEAALDRAAPLDLVINCAGILSSRIDERDPRSVHRAIQVNSLFPLELALGTERRTARLIHISTDGVFAPTAGLCFEETDRWAHDLYGTTKRLGEPGGAHCLVLRCSILGRDALNHRGLVEWVLGLPAAATVDGYTDHLWNGLTTVELARLLGWLARREQFDGVRAEGPVRHLASDPPTTKYAMVELLTERYRPDVTVRPSPSGHPVSRLLASRLPPLAGGLGERPSLGAALGELFVVPPGTA